MDKKRILTLLTILLMVTIVYAQPQKKNTNPELAASLLYLDGIKALINGDPTAAKAMFNEVTKYNPTHIGANYQLAQLSIEKDPKQALSLAEAAYKSDSTNLEITRTYGRILLINNQFDKAKLLLTKLREKGKNKRASYYFSIMLAEQMGDNKLLETLSNEYIENWGYDSDVINSLYEVLLSRKEYAEAEKLLDKHFTDNQTDQLLLINLARIKAVMMDDNRAIELYHKAIDLDSTDFRAPLALSDYYQQKKDVRKFLDAMYLVFAAKNLDPEVKARHFEQSFFDLSLLKGNYQQVKKLATAMFASAPNNAEVDRVMIRFLMYTGELKTASAILYSQINRGLANENVYKNVIDIHLYNKELDSAMFYTKLATAKFPISADLQIIKAVVQWQSEDNTSAINSLRNAYKYADGDSLKSVIKSFEGDIFYKMGSRKEAFRAYDKALKLHKENAGLLNNYAYYLSLDRRRLEDALRMAQLANELSENNPTYLDTQAWVLYEMGRYEEAREIQRKAIGFNRENSSELLLHYGDILFKLGEKFLAETYWKQALEKGAEKEVIEKRLEQLK